MPDHEEGKHERGDQQREGGAPAKKMLQAMVIRVVITLLCGVGLYASLFMLNKSRRAARGELTGPSVVKTPRAHLFGVPNSLLGALYYTALAVAVWFVHGVRSSRLSLLAAVARRSDVGVSGLFAALHNSPGMPVLLDLSRWSIGACFSSAAGYFCRRY